ncbi:MAG: hypothetical protein CBC16_08135, partial [Verrucomicrobia bacterium TMED56]
KNNYNTCLRRDFIRFCSPYENVIPGAESEALQIRRNTFAREARLEKEAESIRVPFTHLGICDQTGVFDLEIENQKIFSAEVSSMKSVWKDVIPNHMGSFKN